MPIDLPDITPFLEDVEKMRHAFDLDGPTQLGAKLMECAARWIHIYMVAEQDPGGSPWPDLGETYKTQKLTDVGFVYPIGVREGLMRQLAQVRGRWTIATHQCTQTYGLDPRNKMVAERFQEGEAVTGWANHKPRPFYAFNKEAIDEFDTIILDAAPNGLPTL